MLRDFEPWHLRDLLTQSKIRKYEDGEEIIKEGAEDRWFYFLLVGKVRIVKAGEELAILRRTGDIFGETVAFSDNKVWPMTVIAHRDCVLLFLPPDKITGTCSNICASHSTLIMNMLRILSNKASMLDKKIEHISAKYIRGRICSYLLDIYRQSSDKTLTIQMKRHELADYLNIPRPSLSRELGLMRDAGIIEFEGPHITVKSVLKLEESIQ